MAFERFIPPKHAGSRPKATIRPSGLISFDAAAVEAYDLKNASFAILFFDKTKKTVGVKTTKDGKEDGAIKLTPRRRSVSLKAPQFFQRYAIAFSQPQRFDVSYDDSADMLTIDMKTVQRKRGRRPKSAR